MADATADLPEEEKNLQELLRSLKVCLIWSRERAEKIACLELDGYLDSLENEFLAQAAFDDDVDHAEEVLARRATVVADLVGAALSIYARARSPLDDPWMAWRREPPSEPAAAFVRGLTEEAFFCARVAYHTHSDLDIRHKSSVPSDGDLEDIPGYLETEQAWTWREWLDVLGPPQEAGRFGLATAAAKRDLAEGHARSDVGVEVRFAELADQVTAFQMPTIERLERIGAQVDALGAPNKFKAEEFLKEALGAAVYSSLSDDARTAALDSERRFRDLARLSHLEGIRAHKSNGMSKGYTKVFTTKAELITLRSGE